VFTFLAWSFGLAAVTAVSLISLFMIIPLLRTTFYKKSLVFLLALAIGTLVGDSMFHLLPRVSLKWRLRTEEYSNVNKNVKIFKHILQLYSSSLHQMHVCGPMKIMIQFICCFNFYDSLQDIANIFPPLT
jgi:hypothetical protein